MWVFDVADDGSLSEPETFVTTGDGPDGMTVDNDGNLFVATDEGIEVFAPDAAPWGVIPVPQGAKSNCAFGGDDGRTLYITAPPALYRVTLAHPGPSAPPVQVKTPHRRHLASGSTSLRAAYRSRPSALMRSHFGCRASRPMIPPDWRPLPPDLMDGCRRKYMPFGIGPLWRPDVVRRVVLRSSSWARRRPALPWDSA